MSIARAREFAAPFVVRTRDAARGERMDRRACLVAALLCGAATIVATLIVAFWSGRPFVYPLDDAYIHLSMARTFAETGVWGLAPTDPAAASSAPLYTMALAACCWIFRGVEGLELAPLALNLAGAAACGFVWANALSAPDSSAISSRLFGRANPVVLTLFLSALTPLFALSAIGMEHAWHAAAIGALLLHGSRSISQDEPPSVWKAGALFGLSFAATGLRYESVLFIGALIALALVRLRWRQALALAAGGALPVIGFGLWWMHSGGWPLPNSILIKAALGSGAIPQIETATRTLQGVVALHLLALAYHLLSVPKDRPRLGDWRMVFSLAAIFAGEAQCALHIAGWLYRYEAATLALNALGAMLLVNQSAARRSRALALLALALICAYRTIDATRMVLAAPQDRRWEHQATAEFARDVFSGEAIVVNDIGFLGWLAPEVRTLDLAGLANNDIARLRLSGGLRSTDVAAWAKANAAPAALLQICWRPIASTIPAEWTLVGLLAGPRNVVFDDRYVGLFATSDADAAALADKLARFRPREGARLYRLQGMKGQRLQAFLASLGGGHCDVPPELLIDEVRP